MRVGLVPPGASTDTLNRELDAALRAGLPVEIVSRAPLKDFDTGPALRFPHQAQFHPLKYLAAMAKAIERDEHRPLPTAPQLSYSTI
mgnify:CR=1 FL=1